MGEKEDLFHDLCDSGLVHTRRTFFSYAVERKTRKMSVKMREKEEKKMRKVNNKMTLRTGFFYPHFSPCLFFCCIRFSLFSFPFFLVPAFSRRRERGEDEHEVGDLR